MQGEKGLEPEPQSPSHSTAGEKKTGQQRSMNEWLAREEATGVSCVPECFQGEELLQQGEGH